MGAEQTKEIKGGYRIIRISENSPASESDMEIFFDYIVQIDDLKLIDSSKKIYECFMEKIKENENKLLLLLVYNCRYKKIKEVKITPRKWKGNGLLGININYELLNAMNEGARVLDIFENSPACKSDLNEYSDFIIGCDNNIFRNQEELMNYVDTYYKNHIQENKEEKFKTYFYVYNCLDEQIRKVEIEPNNSWGGKGLLGCNIANGFLHKIPLCKKNILQNKIDIECAEEGDIYSTIHLNEEMHNYSNNKYKDTNVNTSNSNTLSTSLLEKSNNINSLHDNTINNNEPYNKENLDIDKSDSDNKNNNGHIENKCFKDDDNNNCDNNNDNSNVNNSNNINYGENNNIKRDNCNDVNNNDNESSTVMQDKKENRNKYETEVNISNSSGNMDNYTNYVKKMENYSKELIEIYESMNRNNEILNNIGISTKINFLDDKINSIDKNSYTNLKNSEKINIHLESYENDEIPKGTTSNNLDYYHENNDNGQEKKTINLNEEVNYIIKENSLNDSKMKKNDDEENNNVDLLINDFPEAGIIYPTTDIK